MTNTMTRFTVARAINGISINGNEYLLDESNEVMKFDTEGGAILFLKDNGYTNEEIEALTIDKESEA